METLLLPLILSGVCVMLAVVMLLVKPPHVKIIILMLQLFATAAASISIAIATDDATGRQAISSLLWMGGLMLLVISVSLRK
jgi:ABC-type siderophore export system fused ATPase/permease subunit